MTDSIDIDLKIREFNSSSDDQEYINGWNQLQEIADISNDSALSPSSYQDSYNQPENLWMIIKEGLPVGCINLTINRLHKSVEIGILIGEGHNRGIGIGKMALLKIIEYIRRKKHITSAIAYVHEKNAAGRRLFESAGFTAGNGVWFKKSRALIYKVELK